MHIPAADSKAIGMNEDRDVLCHVVSLFIPTSIREPKQKIHFVAGFIFLLTKNGLVDTQKIFFSDLKRNVNFGNLSS